MSGVKASRPGLDDMLSRLQAGDVVLVWKLDRLGRLVRHMIDLAADLKSRGVTIRSISGGLDTSGVFGGASVVAVCDARSI